MSRVAYVNGRYVPHAEAAVHVEDRGFQFADGIYEVMAVWHGLPVDFELHWQRLLRGLSELRIAAPMSRGAMVAVLREVIRRNRVRDGIVYLQVTRGVAPRNHPFPKGVRPGVVATARAGLGPRPAAVEQGVKVVSVADIRWRRRDIKSVSLLPNVMAKQAAVEAGAFEAWLVDPDGTVTEASSSNAWIVDRDGTLVTRSLGHDILPGITRHVVADLARQAGMRIEERSFTLDEAKAAREAFITSTTSFVLPVVDIDGQPVANGAPGTLARELRRLYMERIEALTAVTAWQ